MRLINKLLYCLAATVPVAVLAGCSSGGGSAASGPPPEQPSITLATVPTADAAGIYIAQDDGFFAKQGLHIKIVPVNGGEYGLADLQDGSAQLLEGNYVSFILAQTRGTYADTLQHPDAKPKPINLRIIADSSLMQNGNQALYVMPNSPYKTVQALAQHGGATVGVNTKKNIGTVLLGSLLASYGYKVGDIAQKPEALPAMPTLLDKGKVDAAWMPEPFGTQAQQEFGAIKIADFNQGSLENFPIGTVIGETKWVQSHPNTIAAFLRAYKQGQEIADTNRAAVEQALLKNVPGLKKQIAATMTLDTYPLSMDVPVMQRVPDAMYEFHLLPKPYDIINMIQPEPGMIKK